MTGLPLIDLAEKRDELAEGRKRRDIGVDTVDLHQDEIWKSKADAAILLLASAGEDFTAEDVRHLAGNPSHPNAMGARLLRAAKRGVIRCVGIEQSRRAERHASAMRIWRAA